MFGKEFGKAPLIAAALTLASCVSAEQPAKNAPQGAITPQAWAQTCDKWDDWDKPAPPFKVHGNTYYVGTCGIASILIIGDGEHILIDSGTEKGAEVVIANIESLGFDIRDLRFLLSSHEHFDHVGGMAKIQKVSGATVVASAAAAPVLATGQTAANDPQAGMHKSFEGMTVEAEVADQQTVISGAQILTAIETPGHSPGALSWQWKSCKGNDCKTIVYADSLSPVSSESYKFSDHPEYVAAYRAGIDRLAKLDCDVLLTPHPSHSKMVERAAIGTFEGSVTCAQYAVGKHKDLDERLAKEAAQKDPE